MTDRLAPRGRLKVFLGYAAGVGKTYQMLSEAHELKDSGVDVVIGYFEPHGRKETIALSEGLETIPRKIVEYRGTRSRRWTPTRSSGGRPQVAVVDEFPHTNVPGSPRLKRWEDVHVLLDAGIDVLTTMNVQHLESLNDQIWQSTGVRVRETIPDWVLKQADEVVMVDLTPRALLNRLARGVVYPPERAPCGAAELLQGIDARRAARTGDASGRVRGRQPAARRRAADAAPSVDRAPSARAAAARDRRPTRRARR